MEGVLDNRIFLLLLFSLTTLTADEGTETNMVSEYVDVRRIDQPNNRIKRGLYVQFPVNLVFQIETGNVNITLTLERCARPGSQTPVYTIERDGINFLKNAKQDNFGVYQDITTGASVLVKVLPWNQKAYELFGSFALDGEHYQVEPLFSFHRKRRSADEWTSGSAGSKASRHRLKRQTNPYGVFLGDELLPPPENSGLNRVYDIPPYPGKPLDMETNPVPLVPLQMSKPNERIFDTTTEKYESDVLLPMSQPGRRRRESSGTMYIEYMVVVDYRNLEGWKNKVGGTTEQERVDNAFDAMHEFYQFVVNGIDVRFRSATRDGSEIRVVFASLLVSTEESTSPWITNNMLSPDTVDDAGVLLDFATWKNSVYQYLPSHDHAGLFTGFDIATPTSLTPIGMGYLNSICHTSWGVSEIEETYNAVTIHIAAHELGHNMGTRHDGNGNACASSSLYLMASRLPFIYNSALRTNPWTFSSCSQDSIKTFIDGLGSSNCLTNVPATSSLNEEMAGLAYSADDQCNMTYGNNAALCRDNLYYQWDSVCYAMQCKLEGHNSCVGRFFPFDGTPCGDKKWCQSGECVFSEDAPSYSETCLFGDDPTIDCTTPSACDENDLYSSKVRCCATCSQTTTSSTSTTSSSTSSSTASSTTSTSTATSTSSTSSTTSAELASSSAGSSSATSIVSSTSNPSSTTSSTSPMTTSTTSSTTSSKTSTTSTSSSTANTPETATSSLSKTVITTPFTTSTITSATTSAASQSPSTVSSGTSAGSSTTTAAVSQSSSSSSTITPTRMTTESSSNTQTSASSSSSSVSTTSSSSSPASTGVSSSTASSSTLTILSSSLTSSPLPVTSSTISTVSPVTTTSSVTSSHSSTSVSSSPSTTATSIASTSDVPTSASSQSSATSRSTISSTLSTQSPQEELTFELQSMISLFIASALVI